MEKTAYQLGQESVLEALGLIKVSYDWKVPAGVGALGAGLGGLAAHVGGAGLGGKALGALAGVGLGVGTGMLGGMAHDSSKARKADIKRLRSERKAKAEAEEAAEEAETKREWDYAVGQASKGDNAYMDAIKHRDQQAQMEAQREAETVARREAEAAQAKARRDQMAEQEARRQDYLQAGANAFGGATDLFRDYMDNPYRYGG